MEAGSRGRLLNLFGLKRREAKNVKCPYILSLFFKKKHEGVEEGFL